MTKFQYVFLGVSWAITFSCSPMNKREETLNKKIILEPFLEAKTSFPGLGCLEDTFATKIVFPDFEFGYKEILYSKENNIDWTSFVQRILDGKEFVSDTTIFSGRGEKTDTVLQIGFFKAIPLIKDSVFLFPPHGVDNRKIEIFVNEKTVTFNQNQPVELLIPKNEVDSLKVKIDQLKTYYFKFEKEYNGVHFFYHNDTLVIRMVYVL